MRILFANIGWMTAYQGNTKTDYIKGGGSWNDDDKHEVYNFMPVDGWFHGYAQPSGKTINLNTIDKDCSGDILEDVLVVWVAPFEGRKSRCIVGWYNHATVYRNFQKEKKGIRNEYAYNIKAKVEDCTLLPVMERTFEVPRSRYKGEGFTGRPTIWYADSTNQPVVKYRSKVWSYIQNYSPSASPKAGKSGNAPKQYDQESKKRVEDAAIKYVIHHFESLGFSVESKESDKLGWDLEAEKAGLKLLLEVKGLSGNEISVRITKNEYEKMLIHQGNYFLCVVTNAIKAPTLYTFELDDRDEQDKRLVSNDGNDYILKIELIPSYHAYLE